MPRASSERSFNAVPSLPPGRRGCWLDLLPRSHTRSRRDRLSLRKLLTSAQIRRARYSTMLRRAGKTLHKGGSPLGAPTDSDSKALELQGKIKLLVFASARGGAIAHPGKPVACQEKVPHQEVEEPKSGLDEEDVEIQGPKIQEPG